MSALDRAAPPGKQRTSQERGFSRRFCKKARLRREPRAHVPHWATKAVCSSSSVTAKITTTFQSCHRARRLLHFPRRRLPIHQSDGNGVQSNDKDVPRNGDPESGLIVLEVSLFLKKKTHRVFVLPRLVSACLPIFKLSKFKLLAGFHVRVWFFYC